MKEQRGFSSIEGLLIIVIVGIVGLTGWYVWQSRNNANKSYNSTIKTSSSMPEQTIKNFDECKKSPGSKTETTYPEICVTKSGLRFTQTVASSQQSTVPKKSSTTADTTAPSPTSTDDLSYTARIISDACVESAGPGAVGDVGCSITIGSYSIQVVHGNTNTPHLGTVTGLNLSIDQTGSTADVYALKTGSNTASIWSDAKYYVHIH